MISETLYAAAFAFRKTKLWKQLYDSQLFALKHADGTVSYCCVMGMMGEHLALAVYPDAAGLASYRRMGDRRPDMSGFEHDELLFAQECIMCSFEDKDEMLQSELAEVRSYCKAQGIALRGKNAYPKFQRCRPGYYPWRLDDAQDQAFLLEALKAAVEVSKKLETAYAEDLGFTEGPPFDRSIPLLKKHGRGYSWGLHAFPAPSPRVYPAATIEDELRLKRIKRLGPAKSMDNASAAPRKTPAKPAASAAKPRNAAAEWDCDMVMYPNVARQEGGSGKDGAENEWGEPVQAPFFPYLLMVVDHQSGMILYTAITRHAGEYARQLGEMFLDFVEEQGIPAHLYVRNDRAHALLSGIAEKLGIPLTLKKRLPILEELLANFYEQTAAQEGGEPGDEDASAFLEQLADPTYLKALPSAILREIVKTVRSLDPAMLPEGLQEGIEAEINRRKR